MQCVVSVSMRCAVILLIVISNNPFLVFTCSINVSVCWTKSLRYLPFSELLSTSIQTKKNFCFNVCCRNTYKMAIQLNNQMLNLFCSAFAGVSDRKDACWLVLPQQWTPHCWLGWYSTCSIFVRYIYSSQNESLPETKQFELWTLLSWSWIRWWGRTGWRRLWMKGSGTWK